VHPTVWFPKIRHSSRLSCSSCRGTLNPGVSPAAQVVEAELQQLFGGAPGFQQVKMNRGPRGTTCFVEFSDVATAMAAHQQHQVSCR